MIDRPMGMILVAFPLLCLSWAAAQVEHVPVTHPVYEFLDRLGVEGVLPAHSSSMVPLERTEVLALLRTAASHRSLRGDPMGEDAEQATLARYLTEFAPDAGTRPDEDLVLLGAHESFGAFVNGLVSQKQKYLVVHADSFITVYGELLGSVEYRSLHGDSRGNVDAMLTSIGGRFRGTIAGTIGYLLQSTNGVLLGNRSFALSDPRLATNVKLNEPNSRNFDVTEAYLRYSFGWGSAQFGREFVAQGVGYGDRLILSDNAPAFDAFGLSVHYKSFRFQYLHASLLSDPSAGSGLLVTEPEGSNKYLALHRFQFSLFDRLNVAASEMVIYQRLTPEYAYLLPVNFFKSAEHALRDRDNALLVFDFEYFPYPGYKLYGTWLIDDVDFKKIGTGWWGNEFGWQGGAYVANIAGLRNLDAIIEYTRIEPYVYSNRLAGNDYSNSGVGLGHRLQPNSDEILAELRFRVSATLRTRLHYAVQRHGQNVTMGDSLIRNVGGALTQGHRNSDSETAPFLDGELIETHRVGIRAEYEPVTDLFLTGVADWMNAHDVAVGTSRRDLALSIAVRIEY
jgi:hypothetical protein